MWIRDSLFALTEDFRGGSAKLVIGYLLLSLLFLVYIYGGKKACLNGGCYGLPGALATSPAEARKKVSDIVRLLREKRQLKDGLAVQRADLERRLSAAKRAVKRARLDRVQQQRFIRYGGWFFSGFFFLFVIPVLFIVLHPRLKPVDFGLGPGNWKLSLRLFGLFSAVMLAAVAIVVVFRVRGFLHYYPMFARGIFRTGRLPLLWFVFLELLYLFYFIGWEFYFRSLIIFPLEDKLGSLAALVGVLPFAIMHVGKPIAEAFGSIVAAYFLGVLALKTRSFWICALLHFLIAFSMDLTAVVHRGLV